MVEVLYATCYMLYLVTCSSLSLGYVVFFWNSVLGLFDPVFLAVFSYKALGRHI